MVGLLDELFGAEDGDEAHGAHERQIAAQYAAEHFSHIAQRADVTTHRPREVAPMHSTQGIEATLRSCSRSRARSF